MAMPWECFCFDFDLALHVATLGLLWLLAHLFPAAWAGIKDQCKVYLPLMPMN
jgi:hypothetical protein